MEEQIEDGRIVNRFDLVPAPVVPRPLSYRSFRLDGRCRCGGGGGESVAGGRALEARAERPDQEHLPIPRF